MSQAVIKVVGVGGAGSNAVQRMIEFGMEGVEFIAMNTDVQVLDKNLASKKLQLGVASARGLGAGGNPTSGREAAEEVRQEIKKLLDGADMVFVTAGMGGGTGTGAAPVVAEIAREMGALTVAVVTKPFRFEGAKRTRLAEEGIAKLRENVDTIIAVPNERLMNVVERRTSLSDAFKVADDILRQGVQGISDIITIPGQINVDFADVRAIMTNAGPAIMGIGYGVGEHRALQAAQTASASGLLETSIQGAKGLLVNITSGIDLTLAETNEAMSFIHSLCDSEDALIFFGTVIDPEMEGAVRVTVLATGFDGTPSPNAPKMDPSSFSFGTQTAAVNAPVAAQPVQKGPVNVYGEPVTPIEPHVPASQVSIDTVKPVIPANPGKDDDFDVPAFIRRHRQNQEKTP